ncbi:MAG TPA: RNA 2',3'-cyclic phosphodiesterase [Candidatus Limnocylindrales bacterium]|nr:RNA 2',3'-cyclic phosphodiesterase [Candidatus Limnocylindrales bacterium]
MRLFVALDFPDSIRHTIRELIARLKPAAKGARWVRPEGMHVTLKFIGHVDAKKVAAIEDALAPVRSAQPVEMFFRGIGFFPNDRRPRVVWCGIEASANLAALAADVERALVPLGIAADSRDFVPHLTLARFEQGVRADELVRAASEFQSQDFGSAKEIEFHLFESILKPSGAEYKKVRSYSFMKEKA